MAAITPDSIDIEMCTEDRDESQSAPNDPNAQTTELDGLLDAPEAVSNELSTDLDGAAGIPPGAANGTSPQQDERQHTPEGTRDQPIDVETIIKEEVKDEPGFSNFVLTPFIHYTNTIHNPIILDDDEDNVVSAEADRPIAEAEPSSAQQFNEVLGQGHDMEGVIASLWAAPSDEFLTDVNNMPVPALSTPQALSNPVAQSVGTSRPAPRKQDPNRLAKLKQMQLRAKELALQKGLKDKSDDSDPDDIDKQAKAAFEAKKAAFGRLKDSGNATDVQEIEFLRLQRIEEARRRKFLEDKMREAEDNDVPDNPEQGSDDEDSDDGIFVGDPAKRSALGKRGTDGGGKGGNDKIFMSDSDDDDVYQGPSSSKRRKPEHPHKASRMTQDYESALQSALEADAPAGKATNARHKQPVKRGRPKLSKATPKPKNTPHPKPKAPK
ncbi:hypothetical protein LTS18_010561, partial [Coniosporium uncinatum]